MCIAIHKPKNAVLDKDILKNCFDNNPDGAGYCYSDNGKLIIRKGFFKFDDFYNDFEKNQQHNTLIHFRIRTHGAINKKMCHPYKITQNIAMIHNGIISGFGEYNSGKSDTFEYIEKIIRPLVSKYGENILLNKSFKRVIESQIGSSKLMFLFADQNKTIIYNKDRCNSDKNVLFSNMSWKPYVPPVKITPTRTYESSWLNDSYYSTPFRVEELTNFSKEVFRKNYVVKLKYNTRGLTIDTMIAIDTLWSNNTIDGYNMTSNEFIKNLHISSLELIPGFVLEDGLLDDLTFDEDLYHGISEL